MYTGDVEATPDEILKKVKTVMNVDLDGGVKFIYLTKRRWLEPERYPYFTLLGQCIGSMYLAFEALHQLNPGFNHTEREKNCNAHLLCFLFFL